LLAPGDTGDGVDHFAEHHLSSTYRSFARTGKIGSETIGAVGVSGAPGGDKDEACANAGLAKISERLN
jgi:hypothetical protein